MRLSFRIAVAAFVLLSLLLFTRRFDDIRASWDDYRAGARLDDLHHNLTLGAKPPSDITIAEVSQGPPTSATSTATSSTVHDEEPGPTEAPGSKVIVMAKLERENTDWVAEYLLDWQRAIYTVDNPNATLHTPINKGKEAMAYLTYVIEHYSDIPETIVFLHSHHDGYPQAWHTDADNYDNVASLRTLNIGFVQRNGYANLRCIFIPGCPDEIQPFREPWEGHRETEHLMPDVWRYMFGDVEVPRRIGVACCSQFAVSRKQVHSRPLADYERCRQWLLDTELSDDASGRVMEYIWHIIFGQEPV